MSLTTSWHPEAEAELIAGARWYHRECDQGIELILAVDGAVGRAESNPRQGVVAPEAPASHEVRRLHVIGQYSSTIPALSTLPL